MTFSDSKIVKLINDRFEPAWEAVAPVRIVTFDLGEGRSLKGTISGEIAVYFCTPEGKVFDILPALQSPAATRKAMEEALAFYDSVDGKMTPEAVQKFHQQRLDQLKVTEKVKIPGIPESPNQSVDNIVTAGIRTDKIQKAKEGIEKRENAINEAEDAATKDLRVAVFSKSIGAILGGDSFTVVEPGGRGYYRWEVDRRFVSVEFWSSAADQEVGAIANFAPDLKTPAEWSKELFEVILKQPLEGGEVEYDSDSLEAIRIIGE